MNFISQLFLKLKLVFSFCLSFRGDHHSHIATMIRRKDTRKRWSNFRCCSIAAGEPFNLESFSFKILFDLYDRNHLDCIPQIFCQQKQKDLDKCSIDVGRAHDTPHELIYQLIGECCREASFNGHLDCFKFFMNHGIEEALNWFGVEFKYQDVSVVLKDQFVMFYASGRGHLNILEYAVKKKFSFCDQDLQNAASHGNVGVLEYANSIGCSFPANLCLFAVEGGFFTVLEFMSKINMMNLDEEFWVEVGRKGNVDFLTFGLENEFTISDKVWETAAIFDRIDFLKIAFEKNIPIAESVWIRSTECYRTLCIVFALGHDIPLTDNVWIAAAKNRNHCVLKIAALHGVNFSDPVRKEILKIWEEWDFDI